MFFASITREPDIPFSWPANYPIWWVLREESTKIRTETRKHTPIGLRPWKHLVFTNTFMVQIIFSSSAVLKTITVHFLPCQIIAHDCIKKCVSIFKTSCNHQMESIAAWIPSIWIFCSHIWKSFFKPIGLFCVWLFGNRPSHITSHSSSHLHSKKWNFSK